MWIGTLWHDSTEVLSTTPRVCSRSMNVNARLKKKKKIPSKKIKKDKKQAQTRAEKEAASVYHMFTKLIQVLNHVQQLGFISDCFWRIKSNIGIKVFQNKINADLTSLHTEELGIHCLPLWINSVCPWGAISFLNCVCTAAWIFKSLWISVQWLMAEGCSSLLWSTAVKVPVS